MGWTSWQTNFKGMMEDRLCRQENEKSVWEVIAHCFRGSPITGGVLYYVVERTDKADGKKERFIAVDLIRRRGRYEMAYKDMCESMHPFNYSCPLKYLDMVPVANEEWRVKVREYHDQITKRRAERKEERKRQAEMEKERQARFAAYDLTRNSLLGIA
jgi:hypothetical protein